MTSNAKIGLLLGLAIIFLIVFVINGMSGFDKAGDDNPSPVRVKDPPGIKPYINLEAFTPAPVPEQRPKETLPPEDKKRFQVALPKTMPPVEAGNYTEPVEQVWPKVYVVCQGDNLAGIAKMFYGPEEGNKKANVHRIFEANSKSLESADMIYPGQKLIIPSLRALVNDKNGMEGIFPEAMFEKVESVGRRHL